LSLFCAIARKMIKSCDEKERRNIELGKMKQKNDKKLAVVLGPTASGKSALAVLLAKKFNGEVISADSRQVYKGLDIGSGKITKKEMAGIPHYLLDVASPKRRFTVSQYRKLALKAIQNILARNKLPILCGGTAFYIYALIDGLMIPQVAPDWRLRLILEKETTEKLYQRLKKLDCQRAKTIDKYNRRRLIRALEIIIKTRKPVPELKFQPLPYSILILGIKKTRGELGRLIRKRLLKRLKQGMVAETKNLRKSGLSWKRLEEFGLEYRYASQYLQKKISHREMIEKIQKESEQFAKRQMTWFKRDKRIQWVKNKKEAEELTRQFFK